MCGRERGGRGRVYVLKSAREYAEMCRAILAVIVTTRRESLRDEVRRKYEGTARFVDLATTLFKLECVD